MNMKLCSAALLVTALWTLSFSASKPLVALDCFHNTETPAHYTWEQTGLGGFSNFGGIIVGLGADTTRITKAFDSADLAPYTVLIVANPCTTTNPGVKVPNYIADSEAVAVDKWVQRGGKLMMFANNVGNCEFRHFNVLAGKFGIRFNQNTQSGGSTLGPVPKNEVFANCSTFYIVGMCNISITSPAKSIFTFQDSVLMAIGTKGTGSFFAVGDPWVYNEHLAAQDNVKGITDIMKWILGLTSTVSQPARLTSGAQTSQQRILNGKKYLINGRLYRNSDPTASSQVSSRVTPHGAVTIDRNASTAKEIIPLTQ